jgi:hypothetical protein
VCEVDEPVHVGAIGKNPTISPRSLTPAIKVPITPDCFTDEPGRRIERISLCRCCGWPNHDPTAAVPLLNIAGPSSAIALWMRRYNHIHPERWHFTAASLIDDAPSNV